MIPSLLFSSATTAWVGRDAAHMDTCFLLCLPLPYLLKHAYALAWQQAELFF